MMTAFGSLALITLCISRQADVDLRAQFQSQEHNLEYLRLSSTLSEQAANDVHEIALDACNDTSKLHQANYEAAYFQAEIKDERIANIVQEFKTDELSSARSYCLSSSTDEKMRQMTRISDDELLLCYLRIVLSCLSGGLWLRWMCRTLCVYEMALLVSELTA
jgi:hypothetical protein